MAKTLSEVGYGAYWRTWGVLLMFTVLMLLTGYVHLPKLFVIVLLLGAMLVKASLIGAQFMHLRYEKLSLIVIVAGGILITAVILFSLIAFDGLRILRLSWR